MDLDPQRGYTRVNNILKQLEDISEDGSDYVNGKFGSPDGRISIPTPAPGYDTNQSASRRGSTKSG